MILQYYLRKISLYKYHCVPVFGPVLAHKHNMLMLLNNPILNTCLVTLVSSTLPPSGVYILLKFYYISLDLIHHTIEVRDKILFKEIFTSSTNQRKASGCVLFSKWAINTLKAEDIGR